MDDIREGTIYKILVVEDTKFPILYGYYSDMERKYWKKPTPIFPDFLKSPQYTAEGYAFASAYQDVCEYYAPKVEVSGEDWCNDCRHFQVGEETVGVCKCKRRKKDKIHKNEGKGE